jgi:hypothetical protein
LLHFLLWPAKNPVGSVSANRWNQFCQSGGIELLKLVAPICAVSSALHAFVQGEFAFAQGELACVQGELLCVFKLWFGAFAPLL